MRMITDMENGKIGTIITKDLSRLGRDYLKTGEYIELIFPDYDIRYIAINDNVDTAKSENEMMVFRNVFNDFYAKDTSKKVRAVFKAKGLSGKPLASKPPFGYMKSAYDKNQWVVDEEAAKVVKRIFRLCIDGYGPTQIARILTEDRVLKPTVYYEMKKSATVTVEKPYHWAQKTVVGILSLMEYVGHTVNFKTRKKSYKCKKKVDNPKEEWAVFENTHEAIITQEEYDLVQELRKNKRRIQRHKEVNPFSGMVYCADCGSKMYLCRSVARTEFQEHLKCSKNSLDKEECSAHYIRTCVLSELVLKKLNELLADVHRNEDEFIKTAMEASAQAHFAELKKARKMLAQSEKRISELNKLFKRLYEDNVSGKLSDERFESLSKDYEAEQKELMLNVSALTEFIEMKEQKSADITQFIDIVKKYTEISVLTPEIMHELIERIEVHAPDKSSGHRQQKIDIYFKFRIASASVVVDSLDYDKKRKAA